ncbi:ABC transporter permease [Streptomyces sp. NBC_01387]|nr:ABC transporter permease [Streptomyces sp. NBC_01500]WSC24769.1 ABC transporter permease [Streptomyces sp. NBC_01766]WSV58746.1 ABC transporter permease [Streptomyces sp. NBC_01014]
MAPPCLNPPPCDRTHQTSLLHPPPNCPPVFVGMLLSGSSPLLAGAVQLFVLVALCVVQVVSVALVLELVARGRLRR